MRGKGRAGWRMGRGGGRCGGVKVRKRILRPSYIISGVVIMMIFIMRYSANVFPPHWTSGASTNDGTTQQFHEQSFCSRSARALGVCSARSTPNAPAFGANSAPAFGAPSEPADACGASSAQEIEDNSNCRPSSSVRSSRVDI